MSHVSPRAAYMKKYNDAHKEHRKEYNLNWAKKLKHEVLSHYSPEMKCEMCGINDPLVLTIDHVMGGGHKHRLSVSGDGSGFYSWLRRNKFPEGFQVLCMNCQFRKDRTHYMIPVIEK